MAVSIEHAWNSVALEERIELISRSHATGIIATLASILLCGSIGYGLDQIWLLACGVASSLFVFPLFSSYCWRRGKPSLILAYLAVRAMGRRYAYNYNVRDLDIVLIYRGQIREVYQSEQDKELVRQKYQGTVDFEIGTFRDCWIMLTRGAIVVLTEKLGGAKLDYLTHITHELEVRDPLPSEVPAPPNAIVIDGVMSAKGRLMMIASKYPGAHYVFRSNLEALVAEQVQWKESQERLRQQSSQK